MLREMTLPSWERRYYAPDGGNAFLFYKVHGRFTGEPAVSRARYRTNGVPDGCDLQRFTRATDADLVGLGLDEGYVGRELRTRDPALFEAVAATDECLVLRGDVADPPTLDYFRDAVGLVMALLDAGGIAVFDPQMFAWWSADEWRARAFEPAGAVPRHHVVIQVSEEDSPGLRWYHTRGLRKFGRPDLSVRRVPPELAAGVEDLCNRMIEMQAFGAVIADGQEIRMKSLPEGWICRHRGDVEDPDFNNRHILIGPARRRAKKPRR